ncbi:MAG TPA: YceI family protein, partial [Kofleriaceae bacterium]|nr:YceI family protein [Kofleriaceae bacterium]
MKSPFLPAGLSLAALMASLARWFLQGSGNVYTALEKRFYIPDPDLGWRVSAAHPVWIGIDVCAVVAAFTIGLTIGGYVVRRRESRLGARSSTLRATAWTLSAIAILVPLAAFASGSRPTGAIDALPLDAAQPLARGAIAGELDAPAGRYEVVPHEGTSITARVSAGGETFDARFAGDVEGFWRGNPHDLASPTTATISVAAASVDTGVRARSKHARTGYLQADTYPRITIGIDQLLAAQPAGAEGVLFTAHGTLSLIGRTHSVTIAGTVKRADRAALERLHLTGTILLVKATFSIA